MARNNTRATKNAAMQVASAAAAQADPHENHDATRPRNSNPHTHERSPEDSRRPIPRAETTTTPTDGPNIIEMTARLARVWRTQPSPTPFAASTNVPPTIAARTGGQNLGDMIAAAKLHEPIAEPGMSQQREPISRARRHANDRNQCWNYATQRRDARANRRRYRRRNARAD